MNHAVVSILNDQPAKVRCRTCHSDHDFRHEQAPPPKVDARKAALFNEVLKKVAPGDVPAVVDDAELEIPELDAESDNDDAEAGADGEAEAEAEAEADEPVEAVDPEPKPKKGRGRPKK